MPLKRLDNFAAALAVLAAVTTASSAPAGARVAYGSDMARPIAAEDVAMVRRSCPLGQHYSTYYRRCVWWPIRS